MEKRYKLELVGITYNQIESGVYALILRQANGTCRIPIIIGAPEAQSIECKLQEVVTPRPLTHDLMANMLMTFGITLLEVEIRKLPNGVFAATMLLSDGKHRFELDSRSSDAIALAIRVDAPIYTSETVLLEAGFDPDKEDASSPRHQPDSDRNDKKQSLSALSMAMLNDALQRAVDSEDYEEAARIKSEIDTRKSQDADSD